MASNSFVHCLPVCPAWPVGCLSSLALTSHASFARVDSPKFLCPTPENRSSTPLMFPALRGFEQAPAHSLAVEIQVPVTAAKITPFQNPIHCRHQPISIHIVLSSPFLRISPSFYRRPILTPPLDPHTTCFPQASLLCTLSTPIGRCVVHIGP